MKTKLLPLLFLIITVYVNGQNVTIPDANFKNYLVNNSAINTNGDTEIQISEAAAFMGEIDLTSAGGVLDLTGIETFINLTGLRASGNDIASVNITQNIALETLYLDRNQLTTLDLSQNINLITVDLERNLLTVIDVTSNTSLENLGVRRNNITTLDISQNTALKFLDTSITLITSIDFSSNSLLETYWTQDSVLSSLDLSQNPNVTYISAYNCNLTGANIANTNNANMTIVSLDGNPNLSCIQIDSGFTPPSGYSGWSKDAAASYSDNCTLSVEEFTKPNFTLYPNPTKNTLNIEANNTFSEVIIYNFLGREIVKTNSKTIDVSNLSQGMYVLKITSVEGTQTAKRFIKQ
ncbi:T9SS type A sorting domain-containing protein [Kordia sp.]|uniref:T9SS type A sorting domain-containing protein n=1 Tax=Kordia sp. TaxID=1965332 RepID=UPI003D6C2714